LCDVDLAGRQAGDLTYLCERAVRPET